MTEQRLPRIPRAKQLRVRRQRLERCQRHRRNLALSSAVGGRNGTERKRNTVLRHYGSDSGYYCIRILAQSYTRKRIYYYWQRRRYNYQYTGTDTIIIIPQSIGGHSVVEIGSNVFMDSITSVTLPDSVTSISSNAFSSCRRLTSITIHNSVTSIGYFAFSDCVSLTSITIPASVTFIGESSFRSCSKLTTVIINATTPPGLGPQTFDNHASSFAIKVPAASVTAYKTNWSAYKDYIFPQ